MVFQRYIDMYPETVLFAAGGVFALVTLVFVVYLVVSRKRSRAYAEVLRQETEMFDVLTATSTLSKMRGSKGGTKSDETDETNATDATKAETDATEAAPATTFNGTPESGMFNPAVIAESYTIEYEIGGGNMSRTFAVRNNKLGNPWFLKFISSKEGNLTTEENILKLLNHVSLPKIVDVFYREEGTYLIETLVEGIPLNMLGETNLKPGQYVLVDWFEQMAQTLNYLHGMKPAPVLHLDLKPGNIMVTHDNRLVLVDFGISRRYGEGASGAVTVSYAAPEQFSGRRIPAAFAQRLEARFGQLPPQAAGWQIDVRTDLYSLGVIMFELTTGTLPTRDNLKMLNQHTSKELAAIILKCMAVNPDSRYLSTTQLLEDLRKIKHSKIKMARALFTRRLAAVAAAVTFVVSAGTFAGGYYVFAFENGALLASEPDVVSVSTRQSAAFSVERRMPDGRTVVLDSSQIVWETDADNIAQVDGGRVTGLNTGETLITGRHRNREITLNVRVVEPIRDMVEISQRFETGREVSVFAGSIGERDFIDGRLADTRFFSPASITADAGGMVFIADGSELRRVSRNVSESVHINQRFVVPERVRLRNNELYILTAPFENAEGELVYAVGRLFPNGDFEALFTQNARHTAVEDFAFGNGVMYMLSRNAGLGVTLLQTVDLNNGAVNTLAQLENGAAAIAVAEGGAVYIANVNTGVLQVWLNGELRNFAGLEAERGFIDGVSPRFYMPQRLQYSAGYLYVWDFNTLRRIEARGAAAGNAVTIAGMASPTYERTPHGGAVAAEDVVFPYSLGSLNRGLTEFVIIDDTALITDHKRAVIWRVEL